MKFLTMSSVKMEERQPKEKSLDIPEMKKKVKLLEREGETLKSNIQK